MDVDRLNEVEAAWKAAQHDPQHSGCAHYALELVAEVRDLRRQLLIVSESEAAEAAEHEALRAELDELRRA